jgi:CO/xanthine dehydrogenase Mo-binding subunit
MDSSGYVDDIVFRYSLFAITIRSPVARGRLKAVDCPKLPGPYTLITAADIPGENRLEDFPVPILASGELSYIGEPVALLAGPDEARLEEYADQCRVRCEEEPVSGGNIPPQNVYATRIIRSGDTEKAFEKAKTIVSGAYVTGIQEHWYAEPTGAVAGYSGLKPGPRPEAKQGPNPDHDRREEKTGGDKNAAGGPPPMMIYTATQWPCHVRRSVARALGIPEAQVMVEAARLGVHMDGKIWYPSLIACHAALCAFITRKAVKLILTREEDFRYSPKRNGSEIHIRSALGGKGELLGTEIGLKINLGGQGIFTDEILDRTCLGSLGAYRHGSYTISGTALGTGIPPQGPFSGFGLAQGFFAMERHASHIADTLHQDPAEWRKNFHLEKNQELAIGAVLRETPPFDQLLDTAAAMGDYYRKWASCEILRIHRQKTNWEEGGEPLRGIGIAAGYQGSGFLHAGKDKGNYAVELTLGKDGSLEIKTAMADSGGKYLHIWARMAAEILSISVEKVRLISVNTAFSGPGLRSSAIPDPGPGSLSRNITALTRLVESCCLAIRKQHFRDPLPITVRRSCRPLKARAWEGKTPDPALCYDSGCFSRPGWGAAVVEVEIDQIEYTPKVRGIWLAVDGGKILSEAGARSSLKTSAIQALCWASREQLEYVDGIISREQFINYKIPAPAELPPIKIDFLWNDTGAPKGIGELPFHCIPAAWLQAVSQAMDHHFQKIPLSSADIWEAGKLREREDAQ